LGIAIVCIYSCSKAQHVLEQSELGWGLIQSAKVHIVLPG